MLILISTPIGRPGVGLLVYLIADSRRGLLILHCTAGFET